MENRSYSINELRIIALDILKNIESSRIDRDVLLGFLLKKDRSYILAHSDDMVEYDIAVKYIKLLNERAKNKPVAYIINEKEFMSISFYINENVLIPRPDTEHIVDRVNKILEDDFKNFNEEIKILDLCSGSGAIGLSILKLNPDKKIHVVGSDISNKAIEVSSINAKKLNLEDRYINIESDLFNNLKGHKFNIIVSNPPYIKKEVIKNLDKDVKDFEPILALDGGVDGLDLYKKIIANSKDYLLEKSYLVFEIGYDQGQDVKKLMEENSFKKVEILKDYGDFDRCVMGIFNP